MTLDPKIFNATLAYALQAMQNGNRQAAFDWAMAAANSNPDSEEPWLYLAAVASPSASIQFLEKALKINPDSQRARKGMKWAEERLKLEQAEEPSQPGAQPIQNHVENAEVEGTSESGSEKLVINPTAPTTPVSTALRQEGRIAHWWRVLTDLPDDIWIFLAYLVGVTIAESVTVLTSIPQVGLLLHGLLLTAIILHAALFAHGARQKLLITLALGPLIRLMSLTLPLQGYPMIYWYALVGAPLFLAAFLVYRVVRSGPAKINWNWRKLPVQLLIGLTGVGLGYLEYWILHPAPLIPSLTLGQVLIPALILFIFTGMLEEVIFRGLIQRSATNSLGRLGMLYSALWFAVLHLGYRSFLDVIFVFLVAILFGWVVARTGSLVGVTMAHGLTNIGLYLVIPFILYMPKPTYTAPWVMAVPTAQRIIVPTPTYTPTPTISTPTIRPPTPTHTPIGSATIVIYLAKPSLTPTSTLPSAGITPTKANTPITTRIIPTLNVTDTPVAPVRTPSATPALPTIAPPTPENTKATIPTIAPPTAVPTVPENTPVPPPTTAPTDVPTTNP